MGAPPWIDELRVLRLCETRGLGRRSFGGDGAGGRHGVFWFNTRTSAGGDGSAEGLGALESLPWIEELRVLRHCEIRRLGKRSGRSVRVEDRVGDACGWYGDAL